MRFRLHGNRPPRSHQSQHPGRNPQKIHHLPTPQSPKIAALRRPDPPRPQTVQPPPQLRVPHGGGRLRPGAQCGRAEQQQPDSDPDWLGGHQVVACARDTARQYGLDQGGRHVECGLYSGWVDYWEADLSGDVDAESDREGYQGYWASDQAGYWSGEFNAGSDAAGEYAQDYLNRI